MRILGTLLLLWLSSGMLAQQSPTNIPVSDVRVNECLLSAVGRLSQQYRIVIGAEDLLPRCSSVEVNLKAGTLADLFDLLVSKEGLYNWKYQDGVVIFYGRSGTPVIADLYIRHFGARDVTRSQMYSALDDVPEITNWLNVNNCQRRELFSIVGGVNEEKEHYSLFADEVSLSNLLSRMAAETRSYYWTIHQYTDPDGKCRVQIYLGGALPVGNVKSKVY